MEVWCVLGRKVVQSQLRTSLRRFFYLRPKAARIDKWRLIFVAVPGGLAAQRLIKSNVSAIAYCRSKQHHAPIKRLLDRLSTPPEQSQSFNWSLFARYLAPDILLLLVAVGVSDY